MLFDAIRIQLFSRIKAFAQSKGIQNQHINQIKPSTLAEDLPLWPFYTLQQSLRPFHEILRAPRITG